MANLGSVINKSMVLNKVSEGDILFHYFDIAFLPHPPICSPLRKDKHPSFSFFMGKNGIMYKDFSTKESGGIFTLLSKLWGLPLSKVYERIYRDVVNSSFKVFSNNKCLTRGKTKTNTISLESVERSWEDYDVEYWGNYGITIEWLEFANVHPISFIIYDIGSYKRIFKAEKLAYTYIEGKEGKITQKIYQPLSKEKKWINKHDGSVISLWGQALNADGDVLVVCSSLKDALCLWANTGIPCIAPQGEGYDMSNTAQNVLRRKFKTVYILFDNDKPGIEDGIKLSESTGFKNIILPQFEGGKDISDYYKVVGKTKFIETMNCLIKTK